MIEIKKYIAEKSLIFLWYGLKYGVQCILNGASTIQWRFLCVPFLALAFFSHIPFLDNSVFNWLMHYDTINHGDFQASTFGGRLSGDSVDKSIAGMKEVWGAGGIQALRLSSHQLCLKSKEGFLGVNQSNCNYPKQRCHRPILKNNHVGKHLKF